MSNLTVTVGAETLKRARVEALHQGTSVNKLVGEFLAEFAGRRARQQEALRQLMEASKHAAYGSGGKKWTREQMHERGA